MDLGEPLRLYCERLGPGLLAEPLNALSNLAFFYGAWRLWTAADGDSPALKGPLRGLAAVIALVGAGSLAFHTVATAGTRILDLAFIGVFNLLYLALFLRRVAGWPWLRAAMAVAAFLALDRAGAAAGLAARLNGSGTYLPAIAALLVLTAHARRVAPAAARRMAAAAGVFALSLTARSLDLAVCGLWPWGTHFLWHLLNAWVLYQLSRALQLGAATDKPA